MHKILGELNEELFFFENGIIFFLNYFKYHIQ